MRLCWHDWSKWDKPRTMQVFGNPWNVWGQTRQCKKCGKVGFRYCAERTEEIPTPEIDAAREDAISIIRDEGNIHEAIKDLLWTPLVDNRHGQVQMHNEQLAEAYRRGKEAR